MFYVLWDLETRNVITQLATEEEALAFVRIIVDDGDDDEIAALGLMHHADLNDLGTVVASGDELARLATAPASA